ncbi:MAG: toxin-antitoxin system YwqK family antitoxin [Ekhidna sp.]
MFDRKSYQYFISIIVLLLCSSQSYAQDGGETLDDIFKVNYDTPLTLDLEDKADESIEPVKQKKKKKKRKVFFGIKTRKGYTRDGYGERLLTELFYTLKEYEAPPEYARDFYWYNTKTKKITNSLRINKDRAQVLHGPYKKMKGEVVIEEGWFYKGMKHRRWVRFNKHDILQEKKYWWKGWPEESRLAYYDFKKTQLKEVIPVHFGERNGEYWAFHEDGSLAVKGEYTFNNRTGLWREYYDNGRVKREVTYPTDAFNFGFTPSILREWDNTGALIYDKAKSLKSRK